VATPLVIGYSDRTRVSHRSIACNRSSGSQTHNDLMLIEAGYVPAQWRGRITREYWKD